MCLRTREATLLFPPTPGFQQNERQRRFPSLFFFPLTPALIENFFFLVSLFSSFRTFFLGADPVFWALRPTKTGNFDDAVSDLPPPKALPVAGLEVTAFLRPSCLLSLPPTSMCVVSVGRQLFCALSLKASLLSTRRVRQPLFHEQTPPWLFPPSTFLWLPTSLETFGRPTLFLAIFPRRRVCSRNRGLALFGRGRGYLSISYYFHVSPPVRSTFQRCIGPSLLPHPRLPYSYPGTFANVSSPWVHVSFLSTHPLPQSGSA